MVTTKRKPAKQAAKKRQLPKPLAVAGKVAYKPVRPIVRRSKNLLSRRPHRSFRLTRRRDYKRSLKLPGYWSFTIMVAKILLKNWRLFGGLALTYAAITVIIAGFGAQDTYATLAQTLKDGSGDLFKGNFGTISQAGLLLLASVTNVLSPNITDAQTVLGGLAILFGWLATVWLMRNTLAGHKPRLRDGLYNSGSPVLATTIVGLIVTIQLLPAAIAMIVYSAAQYSGLLEGGPSAMLVWIGVILLGLLSVYWISGSFIALVIVTLPGMYPMNALRAAGDLVVGRRLRVLYRLIWVLVIVALVWLVVMIPIILLDGWLKGMISWISWLPLVPLCIFVLASVTLVYTGSYFYLLYRRIVDDDASPA